MRIALGIDTGGTYTDAVLVDHESGEVLAGAKAFTTRHDLAVGIREATAAVFAGASGAPPPASPSEVVLVGLSTTLATNAMVEGQGGPVCLLLIGYDPGLMVQYGFHRELGTEDFVYIGGGHNELGDEVAPLDEEAIRAAVLARREKVEAFAVSGYFGVRDPAHELRAHALIEDLSGLPVTCGHELSTRLNAVRRATTAALNARLIAPLRELIVAVQHTLELAGIAAPLMVVKGDGSLVQAGWARHRPIETILSGPAASVVGAWHLAGKRDAWVVDVGGTTTDIAALRDGWPTLNADGARVGGWRTMVQAIDVHTAGLGGDSHVRLNGDGRLTVGPRHVVPLSLLAASQPGVIGELRRQAAGLTDARQQDLGEFVLAGRAAASRLAEPDLALLDMLAPGPQALAAITGMPRHGWLVRSRLEDLAERGLVQRAAFTPTDALHVLGRFAPWDAEAARLGAGFLAETAGLPFEALCAQVVETVARRVATELIGKALEDETGHPPDWEHEPAAAALLDHALRPPEGMAREPGDGDCGRAQPGPAADLTCSLALGRPIVAIGAPVGAYLPRVAQMLHAELVIPPHAEVANAVGAVAGGVIQRVRASIGSLPGTEMLRLFLPDGCRDFARLADAVQYAEQVLEPYAKDLARQAGAEHIEVRVERQDHYAHAGSRGGAAHEVYLGTDMVFTATGRPAAAHSVASTEPDSW